MNTDSQVRADKELFCELERSIQPLLDDWYINRGYTVDRSGACKGFDCILTNASGSQKIEEKIRGGAYNDLLIEWVQDLETFAPGWMHETKCDHIHYVFTLNQEITKVIRLNYESFRDWYLKYLASNNHGSYIISPRGWGLTLNLLIPLKDVPANIMRVFYFKGNNKDA